MLAVCYSNNTIQTTRHQDHDTEERLVTAKRGLVTFAKMVMPCIRLTFATVYLSVAVYLYLS